MTTTTAAPSISVLDNSTLYDVYEVTVRFRDKLCGGIPKNAELIASWIKARTGFDDEKTADQIADMDGHVEKEAEKSWIGFYRIAEGIAIECRGIKAMFKECASMLRITEQKRGSKQIFQHGFEVKGLDGSDVIWLGKTDPDGYTESVCHTKGPSGPQSAIKRVDYVQNQELSFRVLVLATQAGESRHVGENEIKSILAFGQENGLGADRSQGRGKFDVVKFEKTSAGKSMSKAPESKSKKAA